MIKPENIIEKRFKGSYRIRCERCGETYFRSRIDGRINPLCGRRWRDDERERAKARAEAKKKADYEKAFINGVEYAVKMLAGFDLSESPCERFDTTKKDYCEHNCVGFADVPDEYAECWITALKEGWLEEAGK